MKVTLHGLAWGWTRRKDIKKKQTHDTTNTLTLPIWFKTVSVTLTTSNWAILQLNNTVCFNRHSSKLVISTVFIDFHAKQKLVPKTQSHLICASLLLALTVQAAIVVLPVCAHGVLFTYKHHFSHAHLHQSCSLQGSAHTEQLLWTNT